MKSFQRLIFIISLVMLSSFLLAYEPIFAGMYNCVITPKKYDDRAKYCSSCGYFEIQSCDIWPYLGISGCGCANEICKSWTENDICDWKKGIKICGAVCNYSSAMPFCSQSCVDTDGGSNPLVKGTVSGYSNQSYSYSDYCINNTMLMEYICFDTTTVTLCQNTSSSSTL